MSNKNRLWLIAVITGLIVAAIVTFLAYQTLHLNNPLTITGIILTLWTLKVTFGISFLVVTVLVYVVELFIFKKFST